MQQSPTTIVGTLIADPVIAIGKTGTSYTTIRIAATRRKVDDGVWSDASTCYLDVKLFKNLAMNVCESMRKGDEVIAVGHLVTEEWLTADNDKRSKTLLIADAVGASMSRGTARITRVLRSSSQTAPTDDAAVEVPADASSLTETADAPF